MFPSIAKTSLFQLSVLPVPLFFTTFGNKRPYVTASHNINIMYSHGKDFLFMQNVDSRRIMRLVIMVMHN